MLPITRPAGVDRMLTTTMPGTNRLHREVVIGLCWATFLRIGGPLFP